MQRLESVNGNVLFIVHVLNLKKPKTESTIFQDCKASSSLLEHWRVETFPLKRPKDKSKTSFPVFGISSEGIHNTFATKCPHYFACGFSLVSKRR